MDCDKVRTFIRRLNQGTLEPGVRLEAQAHIRRCRACQDRVLDDLKLIHAEHLREVAGSLAADPREVQQLTTALLHEAQMEDASSILLEMVSQHPRTRLRVDGALIAGSSIDRTMFAAVISRFERLYDLRQCARNSTAEERQELGLELTGRWDFAVRRRSSSGGKLIELELWDPFRRRLGLGSIGLPARARETLERWLDNKGGLLVLTGLPDSGRTTLLYSIMEQGTRRACWFGLSLEDPPRVEIEGFPQVHVNRAAGLSFSDALRRFIRKDPDLVLIGELDNADTIHASCEAALTDHVVVGVSRSEFSTGVFDSLRRQGADIGLVSKAIAGVVATRLVGTPCPSCGDSGGQTDSTDSASRHRARPGPGCVFCRGTGLRGRTGLFETLEVTDEVRSLARSGASESVIRQRALASGALAPFERAAI